MLGITLIYLELDYVAIKVNRKLSAQSVPTSLSNIRSNSHDNGVSYTKITNIIYEYCRHRLTTKEYLIFT